MENLVVEDYRFFLEVAKEFGQPITILFSFEEINEEYIAGPGSLLPEGSPVSADDLIRLTFSPEGAFRGSRPKRRRSHPRLCAVLF